MKLVLNEEKKLGSQSNYRTAAGKLRKLAAGPMIFELDNPRRASPGDWDRFQVRNIGLAVQRHMAARFAGDAEKFRAAAVKAVARVLGLNANDWREAKLSVLSDFSVALSLVEDLSQWHAVEKEALVKIMRAKAASDESAYLKLMQKHARLRHALIKLGS
jgi:hypothetical protein